MKPRLSLLMIFLCWAITSCKKSSENTGLVGTWKLVEQYNGYANGGNFAWNAIPPENSHTLSFTRDGKYVKTSKVYGNQIDCTGTYTLQNTNHVEITSGCNSSVEKAVVSERTNQVLVLDYAVREGVIRYKYAAAK